MTPYPGAVMIGLTEEEEKEEEGENDREGALDTREGKWFTNDGESQQARQDGCASRDSARQIGYQDDEWGHPAPQTSPTSTGSLIFSPNACQLCLCRNEARARPVTVTASFRTLALLLLAGTLLPEGRRIDCHDKEQHLRP